MSNGTNMLYHCHRCNEHLPAGDFYKCKARASGLQSMCKACDRKRKYDKYQTDEFYRKSKIDYMRQWNKDNPEKAREHSRESRRRTKALNGGNVMIIWVDTGDRPEGWYVEDDAGDFEGPFTKYSIAREWVRRGASGGYTKERCRDEVLMIASAIDEELGRAWFKMMDGDFELSCAKRIALDKLRQAGRLAGVVFRE